jgi:GNAT superfamily N-acetyltransferase
VEVRLHSSVDEFRAIAEPLYRRDAVAHTVELTVLRGPLPVDRVMLTVTDNGQLVGAALQTAPYPLLCNAIPVEAIVAVVAELGNTHPGLVGVRGMRDTAVKFAAAWSAAVGGNGNVKDEHRLYRLGVLKAPAGVPGSLREVTPADHGLIAAWLDLFFREADGNEPDPAGCELFIDRAESVGDRFVLWDVDGTPVSMAMLRAPAADVSRIGPVFTPLNHRGHGYGSAVTAAAAELAHRSGTADVVLFADLANPTSNAIYQRIGFEAVVDSVHIDFVTLG